MKTKYIIPIRGTIAFMADSQEEANSIFYACLSMLEDLAAGPDGESAGITDLELELDTQRGSAL